MSAFPAALTPDRISTSDQIVRDVVRGLYEARYVPGQRLAEPDLMRRYGAGRSTVREAIKGLAAEGVVTTHAFRGAHIRQLSRIDAANVLLVMELLIGLAARQAAGQIDRPGARDAFRDSFERLLVLETADDSYDLVRARNRFYRTVTRIGGNTELDRVLPSIQVHLVRAHLRMARDRRFADYREIADAILAGDGHRAEQAGRAHIRRVAAAFAALPDTAFAAENETRISTLHSEDRSDA